MTISTEKAKWARQDSSLRPIGRRIETGCKTGLTGLAKSPICGIIQIESFEVTKSNIGELVLDNRLQPSISILDQLSPSSQDVIITLIKHLVEKEGITVPSSPAMGLQVPMDGFNLWVAKLNQESYSPRTIVDYTKMKG